MIKLVNVSKYYSTNNVIALGLRKVNLELYRNEFVAIVGESGSGKTTLLNVISGIDSYEEGEMYVNGNETSYFSISDMEDYRKDYVAFVFQSYNLIDSYTVLQNVEAPLILSGYPQEKIRDRAMEIIKRVGLEEHISHKATKLSGGQKQRVVIARALAKDCPIIAADEPTGNLDSKSAQQVIELLHEISKEKLVIIVTHDFSQVKEFATRKIRVFDGEIVEDLKIKKVDKLDLPTINHEENKLNLLNFAKISLRNLLAVPKKTLLMLIVFIFFSFFVGYTYGAAQLIENEMNYDINRIFINANPNRIVVRKDDNSAFEDEELAELADYSFVETMITNDYVLDQEYYINSLSDSDVYIDGVFLPLALIDDNNLEYGNLPTDDDQLVIALPTAYLSSYEDYLYKDFYLGNHQYEVVGLVDVSSLPKATNTYYRAFFFGTEANLEQLGEAVYLEEVMSGSFEGVSISDDTKEIYKSLQSVNFIIDNSLANDEVGMSAYEYFSGAIEEGSYTGVLTIEDYYHSIVMDVTLISDEDFLSENTYYVNQNLYDQIFYDEIYQVTLFTNTETGVSRFVNTLDSSEEYHAVYPFDIEPYYSDDASELLLYKILLIFMNVVVLIGATLITYVIFRAIINTKLPDYAIFRTIGANKSVVKKFIYIENIYIVLVTYLVFVLTTLLIPYDAVYETFLWPLKSLTFMNYLVFLGLLILMSLIISGRYCNRIYEKTVQSSLKSDVG